MRATLGDPVLQEHFADQGYVVAPFVDPARLDEIRRQILPLIPPKPAPLFGLYRHDNAQLRRRIDDVVRPLLVDEVGRLFDRHRIYLANLLVKFPDSNGFLDLHQDWAFVDESRFASGVVWLPLDATDSTNGGLDVVAGSHRVGVANRGIPPSEASMARVADEMRGRSSTAVSTSPGEAIVYDNRLIHGSSANVSDQPRIVVALGFLPEEADLVHYLDDDQGVTWRHVVADTFFLDYEPGVLPPTGVHSSEPAMTPPDPSPARPGGLVGRLRTWLAGSKGEAPAPPAPPAPPIPTGPPPVIDETFPVDDVAAYYDDWNERYEAVFGDVFQHLKAGDHAQLLDHMIDVTGMAAGERLVDAGCGVCGPARHFARATDLHIDAVTISPVQVERGRALVAADGLADRIDVHLGDFHHLDQVLEPASADLVYFLEALVHAHDPLAALRSAFTVLRPGGRLYVKDFYRGRSDDGAEQRVIDECVEATNRICHLTIRNTEDMVGWVAEAGFEVEVSQALDVPEYSIADGHEFCRRYDLDVAAGRDFTTTFYLDNLEIMARKPR